MTTPIQEYFETCFKDYLKSIGNSRSDLREFNDRFDPTNLSALSKEVEEWATSVFDMSYSDSSNGPFKAAVWKTLDLDELEAFILDELSIAEQYYCTESDSECETQSEAE